MCHLSVDFQQGVCEEIYRAGLRSRFDYEVASFAELEAVSGVMAEVIGGQAGILVALADVDGPPLAVGVKLGPAVVAVHTTFVSCRGNRRTDSKPRRYVDGPAKRNEVGMKIRTISRAHVTGIDGVAFAPAVSVLNIAHAVDGVIVDGPGTNEIGILARNNFFCDGSESLIVRNKPLGCEIFSGLGGFPGIYRS